MMMLASSSLTSSGSDRSIACRFRVLSASSSAFVGTVGTFLLKLGLDHGLLSLKRADFLFEFSSRVNSDSLLG